MTETTSISAAKLAAAYPLTKYNSAKLRPRQVAEFFVDPNEYSDLVASDNVLLIGPRGSGKTTLLKMLHSEALENWVAAPADVYRRRVECPGVFVGVDRMWNEQLRARPTPLRDAVGVAAYGLHIGKSLCRAMNHRLRGAPPVEGGAEHLRVKMGASDEEELAGLIARAFKLGARTSSLSSTATEFSLRIGELKPLRESGMAVADLPDWTRIDPIGAAVAIIERFNTIVGEPDRRWNLLFDELELAPDAIVSELLGRLRGAEELLVYKLSVSPVLSQSDLLRGALGAIESQDVEFVPLTHADRRESVKFTERLFAHHLSMTYSSLAATPRRLLGASLFDEADYAPTGEVDSPSKRTSKAYSEGSPLWSMYKELSRTDPSFERYLDQNHVDLDNLDQLDAARRAATIRKVRNIVVVRSYFQRAEIGGRSRKSFEIYAGSGSMLAIPDGNPRMATAMIADLIGDIKDEVTPRTISRPTQGRAVNAVTRRFMALLLAQEAIEVGGRFISLVDFLDTVGKYLATEILEKPFRADIVLTFKVDQKLDSALLPLVELGVNTGALIHVPPASVIARARLGSAVSNGQQADEASPVSGTTSGRTYRLSYLLAPRYSLPIRLGKTVSLSTIVRESNLMRRSAAELESDLRATELEVFRDDWNRES